MKKSMNSMFLVGGVCHCSPIHSALNADQTEPSVDVYVVNTKQSGRIIEQFMEKMRSGNHEIHRWTGGAVTAGLGWSCSRVQDIDLQSGHITPHIARAKDSKKSNVPLFLLFLQTACCSTSPAIAPSPPSLSILLLSAHFKRNVSIWANCFTRH